MERFLSVIDLFENAGGAEGAVHCPGDLPRPVIQAGESQVSARPAWAEAEP
ncbi:MAG TPA: hypothetical protein VJ436_05625 [Anaerolineales bacterium]|nr:hypothetical protein [Anaerolineales bacterium]